MSPRDTVADRITSASDQRGHSYFSCVLGVRLRRRAVVNRTPSNAATKRTGCHPFPIVRPRLAPASRCSATLTPLIMVARFQRSTGALMRINGSSVAGLPVLRTAAAISPNALIASSSLGPYSVA